MQEADLRFDEATGLLPTVIQDATSGRVLMLGYMNREALESTRESGRVTFFSRKRQALWTKGETSGNWLEPVEIHPDCDGDALLIRAIAHGPTCHTGETSCFGRPDNPNPGEIIAELVDVIEARRADLPDGSYTAQLFRDGAARVSQKVAEEAVELALEAATGGDRVADEAADLLYHVLVLLRATAVTPSQVARELARRRGG